jgi:hypothetical protein
MVPDGLDQARLLKAPGGDILNALFSIGSGTDAQGWSLVGSHVAGSDPWRPRLQTKETF